MEILGRKYMPKTLRQSLIIRSRMRNLIVGMTIAVQIVEVYEIVEDRIIST